MAANVLSRIAVVITANTAQMLGQLGQANNKLALMNKTLNTLKNTLLGTFGAYAVLHAIQNTVKTIADFDREMTSVKVITGATGREFKILEQSALSLGSSTKYSATTIAKLQLELGRLGFTTGEIEKTTDAIVDLATATGEDLARSGEIAGSVMRAFNMQASEMTHITDVIAVALNQSALTLDSFADAIKYVGPVASSLGISLEEAAASISVLADAGIKGTMGGTSYRRILTLLSKESGDLTQKYNELAKSGISVAQANDEVGLYAQTSLIVLTRQRQRVLDIAQAMREADGDAKRMARTMNENLDTALIKVGTSFDTLILSIKSGKGEIKKLAEYLSEAFQELSLLQPGNTQLSKTQKFKLFEMMFNPLEGADASKYANNIINFQKVLDEKVAKGIEDQVKRDGQKLYNIFGKGDSYLGATLSMKRGARGYDNAPAVLKYALGLYQTEQEYNNAIKDITDLAKSKAKELGGKLLKDAEDEAKKAQAEVDARSVLHRAALERQNKGMPSAFGVAQMDVIGVGGGNRGLGGSMDYSSPFLFDETKVDFTLNAIQSMHDAYNNLGNKIKEITEKQTKANEEETESWTRKGIMIAGIMDSVIAKDASLLQSLARTAAQTIAMNSKEIISWISLGLAKTFGKTGSVIAAGLALGVITGLLNKVARGKNYGGADVARKPSARYADRGVYVSGEFRMQGSTAVALVNKGEYQKSRLG